jgi:hypothetical protein
VGRSIWPAIADAFQSKQLSPGGAVDTDGQVRCQP